MKKKLKITHSDAPVPGFLESTPVLTPSGYRPVSSLAAGDKVMTAEGWQDVVKEVVVVKRTATDETMPRVIPVGCVGATKEFYVSPVQRFEINGKHREVQKLDGMGYHHMEGVISYYNIRLSSPREFHIIIGGVSAEPLPVNERMEISTEEFIKMIRNNYGSRPEDNTVGAIFKICRKLPNGMMQIPMSMFNPVSWDD